MGSGKGWNLVLPHCATKSYHPCFNCATWRAKLHDWVILILGLKNQRFARIFMLNFGLERIESLCAFLYWHQKGLYREKSVFWVGGSGDKECASLCVCLSCVCRCYNYGQSTLRWSFNRGEVMADDHTQVHALVDAHYDAQRERDICINLTPYI